MAHWRQNHESNSPHFKSADMFDSERSRPHKPVYREMTVRIERVSVGRVVSREKPRGEQRNFIHMMAARQIDKPLGLNVTNCETLESISGSPDPASWVGLVIQLYVDPKSKYPSGKRGPAIRIRPTASKGRPEDTAVPDVPQDVADRLEAEHQERLGEPGQEG